MIRARLARALDASGLGGALLGLRRRFGSPWLTVLTYHRIADPTGNPFDDGVVDATPAAFDRQVQHLAARFSLIGTDELCAFAAGGPLPPNPLAITFDDGYRDNFDHALPILRRHGARAIFFIATSFITERRLFWWDRICYLVKHATRTQVRLATPAPLELDLAERGPSMRALLRLVKDSFALDLPRLLDELAAESGAPWDEAIERRFAEQMLMTWDQVRALADAGMDVESHTARHRPLASLPVAEAAADLVESRATLERELGREVRAISYPIGQRIAARPPLVEAVRAAGYRIGFSNASGAMRLGGRFDPFDLRRMPVDLDRPEREMRGALALPLLG